MTDEAKNTFVALKESIRKWAKGYGQETRKALEATLGDELIKPSGTSLPALTAIADKIPEIHANDSAEVLAKTLSFDATNSANRTAWQQSGVVKTIKWYSAEDDDVCEFCRSIDGKVIDINAVFVGAGEMTGADGGTMVFDSDVRNPPLHLGCRCYCRPDEISIE